MLWSSVSRRVLHNPQPRALENIEDHRDTKSCCLPHAKGQGNATQSLCKLLLKLSFPVWTQKYNVNLLTQKVNPHWVCEITKAPEQDTTITGKAFPMK